jgi:hypothetical protein
VDYCPYGLSNNRKVWSPDFALAQGFTGRAMINFIEENQLHLYQYNSNGSGCLTWCQGVIGKLAQAGWIERGALNSLIAVVRNFRAHQPFDRERAYWVPSEMGAQFQGFTLTDYT